jgi:site-specific recombinase XerC
MNELILKLNKILAEHAGTRVNGAVASQRSITAAGDSLRKSFATLPALGYRLEKPENLSEKHVEALCKDMHKRGLAPKTMQGHLSHLRIFCGWVGKANMVKDLYHYLPEVPRHQLRVKTVAERSKSWSENGVDIVAKIREADAIDWRFGLMLRLQLAFGLRRMEVIQAIPWKNDRGDKFAAYATKGGRPRDIYIDTEAQRKVLDDVKSHLKKSETLGWTTRSDGSPSDLAYSTRKYSRLLPLIGISRRESLVTGHGLRAQYAENAALIASLIPVTLGGTGGQMEKDEMNLQRARVSESLGHSRLSVTPAYYGSFGRDNTPDAPDRTKVAIETAVPKIPASSVKDIPPHRLNDCIRLTTELMTASAFVEPRITQALWEFHSSRHNTDWLEPGPQNVAALEAAANHFANAV